ncbi:hypothetical protein GCM10023215_06470 [Pseudonocardia yuanmonensis]|uniref:ABC-2 type transport system permease protein n=1 Tax=Pseudonocardia yuanmonensis TaxID=1095914 RepID=A0ABP8VZQ5_9PSEU
MSALDPRRVALDHAAASSTTPLEAAVVLESAGITDVVAAERFGTTDVFALGELALADPHRGLSEPAARPGPRAPHGRWWFHTRGVLYAIPALVALASLPAGDPVASGLVLAGLLAAWAAGYGVTSMAWTHLNNLDLPGAKRFLRRALLVGIVLALLASSGAVLAALVFTSTMSVDLTTVLLLTGQAAYLLAAVVLLLCGREPWLLVALVPAVVGAVIALRQPGAGPVSAFATGVPVRDLSWAASSVVLAVGLALLATRGAQRPLVRPARRDLAEAGVQVGQGLFVAVLVVFPAIDHLVDPGFDPLPLSVTLLALPLVLGMGLAESLAQRFRARCVALLAEERSTARFAVRALWLAVRAHLVFAGALAAAMAGAVLLAGSGDPRAVLLGADYLVLGTALFAATLLGLLGRGDRVLLVLAAGVTALAALLAHGGHPHLSSTTAIVWHLGVGTAMLLVLAVQVRRTVGIPVRHR